jgi:hypothetical protein
MMHVPKCATFIIFSFLFIVPTLGRLFTEEDELNESDYSTPNKWSRVVDKIGMLPGYRIRSITTSKLVI